MIDVEELSPCEKWKVVMGDVRKETERPMFSEHESKYFPMVRACAQVPATVNDGLRWG